MKTLIYVCGTITKNEILNSLKSNIVSGTWVAEASEPYAEYYGGQPNETKPNSLFLFTRKFYFLEEVLGLRFNLPDCPLDKLNIATSIVYIKDKQHPAIRLKFFPDYKQLAQLQECFIQQGIALAPPISLQGKYYTVVHKLFALEADEPGLYFDHEELNKGYFIFPNKLSPDGFSDIFQSIRNNSSCHLFDAEQGSVIINGKLTEIVRIFAEGLDVQLLQCIQTQFHKFMSAHKITHTVSEY